MKDKDDDKNFLLHLDSMNAANDEPFDFETKMSSESEGTKNADMADQVMGIKGEGVKDSANEKRKSNEVDETSGDSPKASDTVSSCQENPESIPRHDFLESNEFFDNKYSKNPHSDSGHPGHAESFGGVSAFLSSLLAAPFLLPGKLVSGAGRQFHVWRLARINRTALRDAVALETAAFTLRQNMERLFRQPEIESLSRAIREETNRERRQLLVDKFDRTIARWRDADGKTVFETVDRSLVEIERLQKSLEQTIQRHPEHIDAVNLQTSLSKSKMDIDSALATVADVPSKKLEESRDRMEKIRRSMERMARQIAALLRKMLGLGQQNGSSPLRV